MGLALISLLLGILCGRFFFSPELLDSADLLVTWALRLLVFVVGIDVVSNKTLFSKLKEHHLKILLIPLGVIAGSLLGGIAAGFLIGMPANVSGAISGGLGWYSLSAVLLKDLGGAQIGTTAFLCNIFRELMAFMTIPLISKYLHKFTAIAPSGATAMDTTLPLIARCTDEEAAIMAVVSGILCTAAVPLIVILIFN